MPYRVDGRARLGLRGDVPVRCAAPTGLGAQAERASRYSETMISVISSTEVSLASLS